MRLELTGRHIDITDGIRRIVVTKLAKLERMLNDSAVSAQVVVSREKNGHRSDVTLHARGEKFLHGIGRGENLGVAMAEAMDKLTQQARKVKGKLEGRKRQGAKGIGKAPEAVAATPAKAAPAPRRVRVPRMLRASRQVVRVMSVSDAAAQVDAGTDVLIFRDAETARIAVVYRAPGSGLTLIETEE